MFNSSYKKVKRKEIEAQLEKKGYDPKKFIPAGRKEIWIEEKLESIQTNEPVHPNSNRYELLIEEIRKRPKAEQLEALAALSDIREKDKAIKDNKDQRSEVSNLSVVQKEEDKKATKKVTFQLLGERDTTEASSSHQKRPKPNRDSIVQGWKDVDNIVASLVKFGLEETSPIENTSNSKVQNSNSIVEKSAAFFKDVRGSRNLSAMSSKDKDDFQQALKEQLEAGQQLKL